MDRKKDDIFSPLKNANKEEKKRRSDSFSKFLKGPDAFRKSSKQIELCSDECPLPPETAVVSEASESKETHCLSSSSQYKPLSEGDVNENTLSIKITSSKTLQDKFTKSGAEKAEVLSSIFDDALLTRLESSCSLKKVVDADNLQSSSAKKNKDFSDTSLTAKYKKQIKDQQNDVQCNNERKHASNTNMLQLCSIKKSSQANAAVISNEIKKSKCPTSLSQYDPLSQLHVVESSVQSGTAVASGASRSKEIESSQGASSSSQHSLLSQLHSFKSSVEFGAATVSEASGSKEVKKIRLPSSLSQHNPLSQLFSVESSVQSGATVPSEASGSKENKKTHSSSSLSQRNPLSQIQSRIEKMVSDAVESQVDNLQQLMWSHHFSLLKALHETKETSEHRHALERETLCKIMEELAEENSQLRNAVSDHK